MYKYIIYWNNGDIDEIMAQSVNSAVQNFWESQDTWVVKVERIGE